MTKVLIYSHDTYGLGNIRRMLAISRHIVDRDPNASVLIVSGSPMLHAFRIPARIPPPLLPESMVIHPIRICPGNPPAITGV
jgi:predicted glycosyltransferase